jgi:hypothetical protein
MVGAQIVYTYDVKFEKSSIWWPSRWDVDFMAQYGRSKLRIFNNSMKHRQSLIQRLNIL